MEKLKSIMNSVAGKIVVIFLVVSIAAIGVVTYISITRSEQALESEAFHKLESLQQVKKQQVRAFIKGNIDNASVIAESQDVIRSVNELFRYHREANIQPKGSYTTGVVNRFVTKNYSAIYQEVDNFLNRYISTYDNFSDIYIICAKHGHVMYSHEKEKDFKENLGHGQYRESLLAEIWRKTKNADKPVVSDMAAYAPLDNEPAMFVAAPVKEGGETIAVVVLRVHLKTINAMLADTAGMGETGELYLVGEDKIMRSDSRFVKEATTLKKTVDTVASRSALNDASGRGIINDYRNLQVLSVYSHLGLDESYGTSFDWALIAEIDMAEVDKPIIALIKTIILAGLAVLAVVIVIALIYSRQISRPLVKVVEAAKRIAAGDLTVEKLKLKSRDELGQLAGAFGEMTDALNDVLGQVNSSVDQVSAGSGQVADASQSLSQGASESASSLEEITSSVTEITAQTKQNSENALQARGLTNKARDDAESGNEQMQNLVKSMDEINQSTDEIKKIVKVIDDISFQISLLALNANVEAARAGKYGKGFAVVAEEVRNLANRSAESVKETTQMVDVTIGNIENVNELVNVTAKQLGEIVNGSQKAADLVEEIATASKEQAQGLDQINTGLGQIDDVTQSNTASAEQSASAAEELASQAQQLKEMVARFKLAQTVVRGDFAESKQSTVSAAIKEPSNGLGAGDGRNGKKISSPDEKSRTKEAKKPAEVINLDDHNFSGF